MPSYLKTCKYCGKALLTDKPWQLYCNAICRKKAEKERIKQQHGYENKNHQERECLYCGQSFITRNITQKFCCKSHKKRHYLSLVKKEFICTVCSQSFTINIHHKNRNTCPECAKAINLQAISQKEQDLQKKREALENRKERIRQQREEEQRKERFKSIRKAQNEIIKMVDNGQCISMTDSGRSSLCRSSFRDGICDTSAFDNHYKWASYGEYVRSADFNLGF